VELQACYPSTMISDNSAIHLVWNHIFGLDLSHKTGKHVIQNKGLLKLGSYDQ